MCEHNTAHLVGIILGIHESRIQELLSQQPRDIHRFPKLRTRGVDLPGPFVEAVDAEMGPILRRDGTFVLLQFHPPSGPQMAVDLREKMVPVADAAAHRPTVDVIKLLVRIRPLALHVVDEELAVGRRPRRLDRAQVSARDLGPGEELGHLQRPVGCARADVEDAMHVGVDDGCTVEATIENFFPQAMDQIEPVLLPFVVGQWVLALSVGVVSPSILIEIVVHGTDERLTGLEDGLLIEVGLVVARLASSNICM